MDPFLRALTEPQADLALRKLANIIAELRVSGLDYQLEKDAPFAAGAGYFG